MTADVQAGFVLVAIVGLILTALWWARESALDLLQDKANDLTHDRDILAARIQALADHLNVDIHDHIDDSPAALEQPGQQEEAVREGPGPERPGPDYPAEWDLEPADDHVHTGWCNHGSCDEPDAPETQPIEAQPQPLDTVPDGMPLAVQNALISREFEGYGTFRFRDSK